jgi:transposase-like protein
LSEGGHSVSQVARDLDLSEGVLRRWKKELGPDLAQGITDGAQLKPDDARLRQQDSEDERIQEERLFIRKATAFFVKEPQ